MGTLANYMRDMRDSGCSVSWEWLIKVALRVEGNDLRLQALELSPFRDTPSPKPHRYEGRTVSDCRVMAIRRLVNCRSLARHRELEQAERRVGNEDAAALHKLRADVLLITDTDYIPDRIWELEQELTKEKERADQAERDLRAVEKVSDQRYDKLVRIKESVDAYDNFLRDTRLAREIRTILDYEKEHAL